jgi:hypothetical protein
VPSCPALARRTRRALIVFAAALCLGAADASARATGGAPARGGAEAGDPAVAAAPSATPAPSASAAKPSRATVRSVQRKLRLRADGAYGSKTRAAVRRFQRRKRLKADGRLGPETLQALGVVGRAARAPATPPPAVDASAILAAIAKCESGGDPTAVSADGQYRGKYQFLISTWEAIGGTGDPAAAPEPEQDQRAAALLAAEGTSPWPVCGPQPRAAT